MSSKSGSFGVSALSHVFSDSSKDVRSKIINLYAVLLAANLLVWILTLVTFSQSLALLGLAVTAYTFGLRHSVDADHISAIDNVTRKLMQEQKKPVAVGFFFSLGHSTIVFALSIVIAITASAVKNFNGLKYIGGFIGTGVSAIFLYLIAIMNLLILIEIFRTFRKLRRGEEYSEQTLEEFLSQRGLMARFFAPLLKATNRSWKMYPVGVLFGLGFDTATEVGILGVSALMATKGLPIWSILLFPLLFTVGMCLLDTTDGILMLGAYGWAFVKPVRKLYYNMNITLISVLVAFVVGTIEVLGIVSGPPLNLSGPFWGTVGNLSQNFNLIGYFIIGIFIVSWLVSTIIYRVKRYDDLEVKSTPKVLEGAGGGE
ncbi:MAG TPA: HoxN/HupN/NixA family nickel/cobalt transporter [Ktedonobacteraceae bacterium]|jgi:high-affinity nickel-transport protein|nr:HoxN/HupN/NixA family nickel/cobalt transporter [Ktedonobacteraceae bacterium]